MPPAHRRKFEDDYKRACLIGRAFFSDRYLRRRPAFDIYFGTMQDGEKARHAARQVISHTPPDKLAAPRHYQATLINAHATIAMTGALNSSISLLSPLTASPPHAYFTEKCQILSSFATHCLFRFHIFQATPSLFRQAQYFHAGQNTG